jgi:hypothetical protein
MDKKSQTFIRSWALMCLGWACAVVLFNYIIDPYLVVGTPRIPGLNARKPAIETQDRLMKTYDALRAAPNTVTVGASRVGWGLDARDGAWPVSDRPVYNLSIAASDPYTSLRYLQHVMSQRHLSLVVMDLNFEQYLSVGKAYRFTGPPDFESRLAVSADGVKNPAQARERMRDLLQSTLSVDALTDSTATVWANLQHESADIVSGNWLAARNLLRFDAGPGSYLRVMAVDTIFIRFYNSPDAARQINPFTLEDVQAVIDLCKSHRTDVIFFVNPLYADWLEITDLAGLWPFFEEWKREITTLTAKNRVPLWDFTDYDSRSTESLPLSGGTLRWFLDCAHSTHALGSMIIKRIRGAGDETFGVRLTPENVEAHLAGIRERQHLYRERHPADVRRVRDWYERVSGKALPANTSPETLNPGR